MGEQTTDTTGVYQKRRQEKSDCLCEEAMGISEVQGEQRKGTSQSTLHPLLPAKQLLQYTSFPGKQEIVELLKKKKGREGPRTKFGKASSIQKQPTGAKNVLNPFSVLGQ